MASLAPVVAAAAVSVVVSACAPAASGPSEAAESITTALSTDAPSAAWPQRAEPGGIAVPECARSASCAIQFALDDGIVYLVGCSAVRESKVSDMVIGRGRLQSEMVTVNLIEGISRSVMVAVSLPGGLCADDDVVLSPWSMAFRETVDDQALEIAACEVGSLSEDQREANNC